MRNPYEYPNEWEAGGEPIEEESQPVHACRGCQSTDGPFNWFNGWPWCRETCYREITALYMASFPHPVTDVDAEAHFAQRRR